MFWKHGDLSVVRVDGKIILRNDNYTPMEIPQELVDDSLLSELSSAEQWHAVGKTHFIQMRASLDLEAVGSSETTEGEYQLVIFHSISHTYVSMDAATATSLLLFLTGRDTDSDPL